MLHNRLRFHALALLVIGVAVLDRSAGHVSAQEAKRSSGHTISYGNVRLSSYRKITIGLAGLHVVGVDTLFELRAKDHGLHRLHADDILVSPTNEGYTGELNGNIRYTLLQSPNGSKLVEGTADHAVYKQIAANQPDAKQQDANQPNAKQQDAKQPGEKQDAIITLMQAHVSLFRDSKEIATLDAGQLVANQQDEIATGTGAVHITARIEGRHADVTADKIIWNRRANTIEASGKAHIAYTGPDNKDAVADSDRIRIDLKSLEVELE